jgi:CRP-like cAMP-binding protein
MRLTDGAKNVHIAKHMPPPENARISNRLLAALPSGEYERVLRKFEQTTLITKQLLAAEHQAMEHAYFPLGCVISLLASTDPDTFVEIATIGSEGMIGTSLLYGNGAWPHRSFAQIPGECLRIRKEAFKEELERGGPFVAILNRYVQMLMVQVAQGAACNGRHSVEQRCARWLLMTYDRVASSEFPLTQEFLCQMLGVRRATVSEIASKFQQDGLIEYTRGNVTIKDPKRLEQVACDCYRLIRDEYSRPLLPSSAESGVRDS